MAPNSPSKAGIFTCSLLTERAEETEDGDLTISIGDDEEYWAIVLHAKHAAKDPAKRKAFIEKARNAALYCRYLRNDGREAEIAEYMKDLEAEEAATSMPPSDSAVSGDGSSPFNVDAENLKHESVKQEDLKHEDLKHVNFKYLNLKYLNLKHEDLKHEDLKHGDLTHENLQHQHLRDPNAWFLQDETPTTTSRCRNPNCLPPSSNNDIPSPAERSDPLPPIQRRPPFSTLVVHSHTFDTPCQHPSLRPSATPLHAGRALYQSIIDESGQGSSSNKNSSFHNTSDIKISRQAKRNMARKGKKGKSSGNPPVGLDVRRSERHANIQPEFAGLSDRAESQSRQNNAKQPSQAHECRQATVSAATPGDASGNTAGAVAHDNIAQEAQFDSSVLNACTPDELSRGGWRAFGDRICFTHPDTEELTLVAKTPLTEQYLREHIEKEAALAQAGVASRYRYGVMDEDYYHKLYNDENEANSDSSLTNSRLDRSTTPTQQNTSSAAMTEVMPSSSPAEARTPREHGFNTRSSRRAAIAGTAAVASPYQTRGRSSKGKSTATASSPLAPPPTTVNTSSPPSPSISPSPVTFGFTADGGWVEPPVVDDPAFKPPVRNKLKKEAREAYDKMHSGEERYNPHTPELVAKQAAMYKKRVAHAMSNFPTSNERGVADDNPSRTFKEEFDFQRRHNEAEILPTPTIPADASPRIRAIAAALLEELESNAAEKTAARNIDGDNADLTLAPPMQTHNFEDGNQAASGHIGGSGVDTRTVDLSAPGPSAAPHAAAPAGAKERLSFTELMKLGPKEYADAIANMLTVPGITLKRRPGVDSPVTDFSTLAPSTVPKAGAPAGSKERMSFSDLMKLNPTEYKDYIRKLTSVPGGLPGTGRSSAESRVADSSAAGPSPTSHAVAAAPAGVREHGAFTDLMEIEPMEFSNRISSITSKLEQSLENLRASVRSSPSTTDHSTGPSDPLMGSSRGSRSGAGSSSGTGATSGAGQKDESPDN